MRGLVIVLLAVLAMFSLSFVAAGMYNNQMPKNQNIYVEEKPRLMEFSTFTTAVCENKEDVVHCKDEFFVNCGGKVSKVSDSLECNGIKVEVPEALGFVVFEKEWKDPRN